MTKLFKSLKYKLGTRVGVEGDSSVGISSFEGVVEYDDGEYVGVRDDQGNYDEYPKRIVWSQKEIEDNDKIFSRILRKNSSR